MEYNFSTSKFPYFNERMGFNHFKSSLRQTRTADLYIISVAL